MKAFSLPGHGNACDQPHSMFMEDIMGALVILALGFGGYMLQLVGSK
jgi:hypothetical protein